MYATGICFLFLYCGRLGASQASMTLPWCVVSRERPSLGPLRQRRLRSREKCGGGLNWRLGVAVAAAAAARPADARREWVHHWRRLGRFRKLMVLATHSSSRKPSHFSPAPKRGKIRARSAFSRRVAAHARGAQTCVVREGSCIWDMHGACSGGPRAHIRRCRCPPLPAQVAETGVVGVDPVLNGTAIVATPAEAVSAGQSNGYNKRGCSPTVSCKLTLYISLWIDTSVVQGRTLNAHFATISRWHESQSEKHQE